MQTVEIMMKIRTSVEQMQKGKTEAKQRGMFIWPNMHPIFGKVISRHRVSQDSAKVKALTDMPPCKTKRELQLFIGIVNYLSKFSPVTADISKPFQRLTSMKAEWMWNKT